MKVSIYILILVVLAGCSKKLHTPASNEILIISSYQDSLSSSPIIYKFLKEKNRKLPIEEDYYSVKWIRPKEFKKYENYPAVVILKLDDPQDETGDRFYNNLFQNKEGSSNVSFVRSLYSENQTIIGLESRNNIELKQTLEDYALTIFDEFDNRINQLIIEKYYKKPKNESIIAKIKQKYGISIFIDHEYEKIKNQDDILWIGRGFPNWGDPYRWIIIREIEPCEYNECAKYIQDTFNKVLDDSYIFISNLESDPSLEESSYDYMYNENRIIGGTYRHYKIIDENGLKDTIPNAGGPYISYIYNKGNSSTLLTGLVNNPGKDKMIYLKQFESIFRDIK